MPAPACEAPYAESSMVADLDAMRAALRSMEDERFDGAGRRLSEGLPCLDGEVSTARFAAAYRYLGVWTWILRGDEAAAARWFRVSLELEPDHAWSEEELVAGHPILAAWDAEKAALTTDPVALSGKRLAGGEAADWRLDGRELPLPEATAGRPHVLQRVDTTPARSWVLDGYRFPPETVEDTGETAVVRRTLPERPEPEHGGRAPRWPLLGASALSLGTAGLAYGLAWVAHDDFESSTTTVEAQSRRTQANAWTLVAGGGVVVGAGLGAWAFFGAPATTAR